MGSPLTAGGGLATPIPISPAQLTPRSWPPSQGTSVSRGAGQVTYQARGNRAWLIAGVASLCVAAGGGGYAVSQLSRGGGDGPREPHVMAPSPRSEPAASPPSATPATSPADPPAPPATAPAPLAAAPTPVAAPPAAAEAKPAAAPGDGKPADSADGKPAGKLVDAQHLSSPPPDTRPAKPAGKAADTRPARPTDTKPAKPTDAKSTKSKSKADDSGLDFNTRR
jgi:hypothetical protein